MPFRTFEEAVGRPDELRRFHVAWCIKLEEMRNQGKLEGYVVSNLVSEPFKVALETASGDWLCGSANLWFADIA